MSDNNNNNNRSAFHVRLTVHNNNNKFRASKVSSALPWLHSEHYGKRAWQPYFIFQGKGNNGRVVARLPHALEDTFTSRLSTNNLTCDIYNRI
jgi:hypothetical protein